MVLHKEVQRATLIHKKNLPKSIAGKVLEKVLFNSDDDEVRAESDSEHVDDVISPESVSLQVDGLDHR